MGDRATGEESSWRPDWWDDPVKAQERAEELNQLILRHQADVISRDENASDEDAHLQGLSTLEMLQAGEKAVIARVAELLEDEPLPGLDDDPAKERAERAEIVELRKKARAFNRIILDQAGHRLSAVTDDEISHYSYGLRIFEEIAAEVDERLTELGAGPVPELEVPGAEGSDSEAGDVEQTPDSTTDSGEGPPSTPPRRRPKRTVATIAIGATLAVGATIAIVASIAGGGRDSSAVAPTNVESEAPTGEDAQRDQSGQQAGEEPGADAGQVDQPGDETQGSGSDPGAASPPAGQTSSAEGATLLDNPGFYSLTTEAGDFFDIRVVEVDEQISNSTFFPAWIANQEAVGLPVPTNEMLMAAVTVSTEEVFDIGYGQIEPGANDTYRMFVTWFESPAGFIDATISCTSANECMVNGFIGQFDSLSATAFQDAWAIGGTTSPVTPSDFDAAYGGLSLDQGRCFSGTIAGVETVEVADAGVFIDEVAGTLANGNPGVMITTTEAWDPSTVFHRQIGINVRSQPDVLIRVDFLMSGGVTSTSGFCLLGDPCVTSTTLQDEIDRTLSANVDGRDIAVGMPFVALLDGPITFNLGVDVIETPGGDSMNYAYENYQEFDLSAG